MTELDITDAERQIAERLGMTAETYVYERDLSWAMARVKRSFGPKTEDLVAKANHLVELMDQAETQHGGLIGSVTLRAKNELRLELSRWK